MDKTESIDNVIHSAYSSNMELATIKEQLNVLKLQTMESVDVMNESVKQALKQHLIKVERALNKIDEQVQVNRIVLQHIIVLLITSPESTHYQQAWLDAKGAFEEFLKDGHKK
jgi:hypothetical protein